MNCIRCGGGLRSERVHWRGRMTWVACMACGDRTDATILANRRRMVQREEHPWKTRAWNRILMLVAGVPA